jgi:hypothetical protein
VISASLEFHVATSLQNAVFQLNALTHPAFVNAFVNTAEERLQRKTTRRTRQTPEQRQARLEARRNKPVSSHCTRVPPIVL